MLFALTSKTKTRSFAMKGLPFKGFFAVGLMFVCTIFAWCGLASEENGVKQPITTVRAEDIGKTVEIRGRLGYPLGTLITVRGKWTDPGYKDSPILEIGLVNGTKLDKPVMLTPGQVEQINQFWNGGRNGRAGEVWDWHFDWKGKMPAPRPELGQTWEMIGVETGAFGSYSKEAREEFGGGYVATPSYMHDFWSRFEFIAVKLEDKKLR
ncbi:MAG TPA: hypothetical protein VGI40_13165 [Pirellulaceae bacterium]